MIELKFTGTAQEIREEMRALMGLDRDAPAPEQPVEEKAAPKPRGKKAPDAPAAATGTTEQSDAGSATKPSPEKEQPSGKDEGSALEAAPDEASLRQRATAYSAKAGPSALVELQKLAGAENGKMSEIAGNEDRMRKLDALLADMDF